MHSLSTTVQLIGTVVTAFGLFYAYGYVARFMANTFPPLAQPSGEPSGAPADDQYGHCAL